MIITEIKKRFFAMPQYIASFVVACASCFIMIPASQGVAQEMQMQCKTLDVSDAKELACNFKFSEPQSLESLDFKANNELIEGAEFTPYSGTASTSAFLFLVDTSNPRRSATVKRNLEIVRDQLRFSTATRLMGVATFANNLNLIYSPQERHSSVQERLGSIVADGAATEFFSSALEGIKILNDVKADRRALVIMSDGKAEDTAYNRSDVINAAREAGVTIIGLGFAEAESETPALQEIRRLAEETNGYFESVVAAEPFPADFLTNLSRYLENGGVMKAPLNDLNGSLDINLIATLTNGRQLSASNTIDIEIEVPKSVEPVVEEGPSFISRLYRMFDGVFAGASDWAQNNGLLAYLLLAIIPLLMVGAYLLMQSRNQETEVEEFISEGIEEETVSDTELLSGIDEFDLIDTEDEATRAIATANTESFGYFEVVGSEENKYQIQGHSVSIGRHSDNDIQLTNDSVHRHHAHLHIAPNGTPTLHDLDTANGLLVNSAQVKKVELKTGDIIELGEVRLRFNI